MCNIWVLKFSLDVISEFSQCIPELHHVLSDGVEVLERTTDVTRAFVKIQGIVQDDLVTKMSDYCI